MEVGDAQMTMTAIAVTVFMLVDPVTIFAGVVLGDAETQVLTTFPGARIVDALGKSGLLF